MCNIGVLFPSANNKFDVGNMYSSGDVMKIFASKRPNGEPLATLSHCV